MIRSALRDESGSALVIALILIGVWSIAIMAVLGFSETGLNISAGADDQRDLVYAADGAVQSAITHVSIDPEGWTGCPRFEYPVTNDEPISVTVACDSVEFLEYGDGTRIGEVVDIAAIVDGQTRLEARVRFDWPEPLDPPDPEDFRRAAATVLLWNGRPGG